MTMDIDIVSQKYGMAWPSIYLLITVTAMKNNKKMTKTKQNTETARMKNYPLKMSMTSRQSVVQSCSIKITTTTNN